MGFASALFCSCACFSLFFEGQRPERCPLIVRRGEAERTMERLSCRSTTIVGQRPAIKDSPSWGADPCLPFISLFRFPVLQTACPIKKNYLRAGKNYLRAAKNYLWGRFSPSVWPLFRPFLPLFSLPQRKRLFSRAHAYILLYILMSNVAGLLQGAWSSMNGRRRAENASLLQNSAIPKLQIGLLYVKSWISTTFS